MTIELAAPPRPVKRHSYKKLMDKVIEADGLWLRISPDELTPDAHRQGALWQAARTRKIKVQTTIQEGMIYVRLVKEVINNAE